MSKSIWLHFWAVQLLWQVLILAYRSMSELVRALAAYKVSRMYLDPVDARQ